MEDTALELESPLVPEPIKLQLDPLGSSILSKHTLQTESMKGEALDLREVRWVVIKEVRDWKKYPTKSLPL